jgi:hypothetical protein
MDNFVSNVKSTASNTIGTTTPIAEADLTILNTQFDALEKNSYSTKFEDDFSSKDAQAFKFNFNALKKELKQELKSQYPKLSDKDANHLAEQMVGVLKGFDDQFQAFAALGTKDLSDICISKLVSSFFAPRDKKNPDSLPKPRQDMANAAQEMVNTLNGELQSIFKKSKDPLMQALADTLAANNKKVSLCDAAKIYRLTKDHLEPAAWENPAIIEGLCLYLIDNPNMPPKELTSFIEVVNQFADNPQLKQLFQATNLRPYDTMEFLHSLSSLRDKNAANYNNVVAFLTANPASFATLKADDCRSAGSVMNWFEAEKSKLEASKNQPGDEVEHNREHTKTNRQLSDTKGQRSDPIKTQQEIDSDTVRVFEIRNNFMKETTTQNSQL